MKSSVIALQAHYKLLAAESAVQGEVILKLTSAIADLRMKIATIESGKTETNTLL